MTENSEELNITAKLNPRLLNYKREITFLIDRQAKIYYHKIDLFHDHEDLITENKVDEMQVCRMVYDPNSTDSEVGIPGIRTSCNIRWDAMPFELKSTHLNAIENWIKQYDEIVKYAEEHKDEYDPDRVFEFVRSMNRIRMATMGEFEGGNFKTKYEIAAGHYKKWKDQLPELKYLDDAQEVNRLFEADLYGHFFNDKEAIKEYKADLYDRAMAAYQRAALEKTSSFLEDQLITDEEHKDENGKVISCKMHSQINIDLARFIEVTNEVIRDSGFPADLYFTIGGKFIYDCLCKIAERACELQDEPLIEILKRLKMVEPVGE